MNITLDDIRSKAPKGATHYDADHDYLKLCNGKWSVWNSSDEIWQPINTPTEETITRFKIKPLN